MAKKNFSGSQYMKTCWSHITFIMRIGLPWLTFIGFIALLPLLLGNHDVESFSS